jgi:hypothetical protein
MEPQYFAENRYSYIGVRRPPVNVEYQADSPETQFERRVQSLFNEGQVHLQHEEYALALDNFKELMSLILVTAHPKMPITPFFIDILDFPRDIALIDTFSAKAADILRKTPLTRYDFPPTIVSEQTTLPPAVIEKLKPALESGLQITSFHNMVGDRIKAALDAAENKEWTLAVKHYQTALQQAPANDLVMRASLSHDLAVLFEKAGNKGQAMEFSQSSAKLFAESKQVDAQVQALDTATGIFTRAGQKPQADEFAKQARVLRDSNNFNPVVIRPTKPLTDKLGGGISPILKRGLGIQVDRPIATTVLQPTALQSTADAPMLMALTFVSTAAPQKSYLVRGAAESANIVLDANATANVKNFLSVLTNTVDLKLITGFIATQTQWVAYLPHMYFYVIPMSIGDCFAGMGTPQQAEVQYKQVLAYPFINKRYELPKLWTRLAQSYLTQGDMLYRGAKDNIAGFAAAKAVYENIVLTDKTLKTNSPLYQDGKFATIKSRVTSFMAAADAATFNDNPAILVLVLEALNKLQQIAAGLNFFGFAPDYAPPFSFEYLQNTARYFAQQASQIEQRYIQFKSQAENEEFRREQLDQQAEVARQTVVLEQRGVAEAQAGINVAKAGLNYAETQRQNAVAAQTAFNSVRWELLELSEAEAWAGAAAVDQDDEVKQTWNGNYYNARDKRRSLVIQELAYRRTRISHDLEAARLQRDIAAANAYKGIAQAQIGQAQARKAIAEQRVQIAKLQQRFAEENRDFLDMREFSASLWYDLAQQAKLIKQRYLDMATEVAFLMERAYNVETERGLHVIRYDYSRTSAKDLLGADMLLGDLDYFTVDHITTTKTKKIPVKKTISLGDSYAMAFQQLKTQGQCFFVTELAHFDREHPGFYLAKLRNVELVFVGITGATSIAGTLRNIGISKFRKEDGTVISRLYPSDVMALSQYDLRQDALAFRFNPNDLRLFENNGIETMWQIELPLNANDFDYSEILDAQLVLYYDGFFSPTLEQTVKGALLTKDTASRAFSMRLSSPDELFYLKNKGDAELIFDAEMFPRNQTNFERKQTTLKVSGKAEAISGLTIRLKSKSHGTELVLKTDAQGLVTDAAPQPLNALRNQTLLDEWTIRITVADNPALVRGDALDLSGIRDVLVFFEYGFDYR